MNQDELKQKVAVAALDYVEEDSIIGVGSGSTVHYFIDALATIKHKIEGTVASSKETAERLKQHGIPVFDLNVVDSVAVYIDGADEVNHHKEMIKGGGGALTREKILASAARKFVCIVDESKRVKRLGQFPLPIEVIPMARSYVARAMVKLGGDPEYREGVVTDNGNIILDIHNLSIEQPIALEKEINSIAGVVCNGLFALRPADVVLLASANGLESV